ncbi:peptidase S24/S26A/S26B/S26C, partial [Mycotypha africana]|uniref:peptidase S24/S26A/S26B/S26C n=1 Tax=Mycotypha africana TaxID=64632 RepID=UPI0023004E2F
GPSMLPYFGTYGIILSDNLSKRFREFKPGDVVICKSPEVPNRQVMKRIIGMPGDSICKDPTAEEREYLTVPRGHIWVGGDNLSMSKDSRTYGPVPLAMVKGRVLAKVLLLHLE